MTLTEDIRRTIAPEWEGFERLLTEALASRSDLLNRINTYLLDASGKKLRPLLALVTAKACSGSINQKAVACAAVSELIHTATLLHDDVVDDSDQRRGRMTVRKLFSPGASLLMGDYWLTRAIHLLIAYGCPVEVLGIYSKSLEELAEGEIIQMELADSLRATEDDYIQVIRRKTASLFIASVKGPAIVAGASEEVVAAMEQYAYWLGCGFQIRDDILDYHSSAETGRLSFQRRDRQGQRQRHHGAQDHHAAPLRHAQRSRPGGAHPPPDGRYRLRPLQERAGQGGGLRDQSLRPLPRRHRIRHRSSP